MHSTKGVDLHVHSNRSDGSLSPSDLVLEAKKKGLCAFALTDHDTVDGIDEALSTAKDSGIRLIPGIELSTEYEGKDIHIVGLLIDKEQPAFKEKLKKFVDSRTERNRKMCQRLTDAGLSLTYEELQEEFPDSVITRAHYAQILLKKGYIKSLKEAFDRYIGDRGPCFVPREKITPEDGVRLILNAKGIPILAHPLLYGMGEERLQCLIDRLKDAGLVGMEAIYSTYTPSEEVQMRRLAEKNGLLPSGGSDFHGKAKPGLSMGNGYGRLYVPEEILTALQKRREELFVK